MKIYVAARFDNKIRAKEAMLDFFVAGHSITLDWTVHKGAEGDTQEAREQAIDDLTGVAKADVFVLLASENMRGAMVEMGVAMAYYKRIFVVSAPMNTIFYSHPLVHHVGSVDEIIAQLRQEGGC